MKLENLINKVGGKFASLERKNGEKHCVRFLGLTPCYAEFEDVTQSTVRKVHRDTIKSVVCGKSKYKK